MPTPFDYDDDPSRYLAGMATSSAHTRPGYDLYAWIVRLLVASGARSVLDVGCGSGVLAERARGRGPRVFGVDRAATMLAVARSCGPVARGEVTALPVADASVDAVVSVNVLDHLPDPVRGLRELRRVLRPDGVLVLGTISRRDSPELAPHWRPEPTPFDAEDAPSLVGSVFGPATVYAWDAPLVSLPDRESVAAYLRARLVGPERAERLSAGIGSERFPLRVTKRGALLVVGAVVTDTAQGLGGGLPSVRLADQPAASGSGFPAAGGPPSMR